MYRPRVIDRNQMLVAGFTETVASSDRDRRIPIPMPADPSGNRPHVHDSPIWLKQFRRKLSQNVVPVSHLCRKLSQDPYACSGLMQLKKPH
ncbi:hypothetical protein CQ13_22335 [Bradyrhizobium retamae]|uniref:Uncharacterized protein n=1 Tax=Bradyrhizobium retamae TaxID=1300035 RepID=A0A0R3N470_9BRAD|nr:hypothetical protein CQ13_22335 [Bradyrhizobium retamae]